MKKYTLLAAMACSLSAFAQTVSFEKPGSPAIFGKDIISDGLTNRDMAISPDNKELYFTIQHKNGSYSVIMHSVKKGSKWSAPEVAWFSGQYNDLEAAFAPDGKRIYFSSNRPLSPSGPAKKDFDIWYVEKAGNSWTGPHNVGGVINTMLDEFYPSVSKSGNLYFTRNNGAAKEDILMAIPGNGIYADSAVALPSTINSPGYDFNAFVDPAESFIIFTSYKRKDDTGGGDLYMSVKENGAWTPAFNLTMLNSTGLDYCPFVSFDRKYFFFTSNRTVLKFPFIKRKKAVEIKKMLLAPGNGNDDIYYLDFEVLSNVIKKN